MNHTFTENKDHNKFELKIGDEIAYANIRRVDGTMYIDYVFSPPELRGTGAAGELMQHVVDVAQKENLHIEPVCGYAASWLKRHRL